MAPRRSPSTASIALTRRAGTRAVLLSRSTMRRILWSRRETRQRPWETSVFFPRRVAGLDRPRSWHRPRPASLQEGTFGSAERAVGPVDTSHLAFDDAT